MPHPVLLHNMSSPPKTFIRYRSDAVPTGHQRACFTTTARVLRLREKQLFEHCRKHSASRSLASDLWELCERRLKRIELPPTAIAYWYFGTAEEDQLKSDVTCTDPLSTVAIMSKTSIPNRKTNLFMKQKNARNTWQNAIAGLVASEPISICLLLPQPWRWS